MIFPLAPHDAFGYEAGLVLGTLIGFAFGFVLERAGFGRAPILAAQFYFTDTRVLKVMFSAIVTALLGVSLLSGLGLLDMSKVTVPETFLWPQLAGGLLLGVGFIVSGYCPGTAVVGAGSAKLDGLVTIVGVGVGALAFGWMYPLVSRFYVSGSMGVARLPDLLSVPAPLLALGVTLMAIGMFAGAELLERITARRGGTEPPPGSRAVRNRVFVGMGVAAALAVATVLLPSRPAPTREVAPGTIAPLALARAMVERPASLLVLDLRPAADCAAKRLPGAVCLPANDEGAGFLSSLVGTRALVVYGADAPGPLPKGVRGYKGEVLALEGGFEAFSRDVLAPPAPPAVATQASLEAYRTRAALSAYFTGTAAKAPPPSASLPTAPAAARPAKHGGGC
jgi:hypothetical protein